MIKITLSASQGTEVVEIGKRCSVFINLLLQLNRVGVCNFTAFLKFTQLMKAAKMIWHIRYKTNYIR